MMDLLLLLLMMGVVVGDDVDVAIVGLFDTMSTSLMYRMQLIMAIAIYHTIRVTHVRGDGRLFWVYPRSGHWWDQIVTNVWKIDAEHQVTFDSYLEYFGMPLPLLETFLTVVEPLMPPPSYWHLARDRIPIRKAVLVVLFRLASGTSLNIVSSHFQIGKSTVIKYTNIICWILASRDMMYGRYVGIPRGERLLEIISGFEQISSLPMIMGAIDGTHIQLRAKPDHDKYPADYWCHKGFHSLLLQGICDHKGIFWSVSCHTPGSQADSTQFRNSNVWNHLHDESLWEDAPRLVLDDSPRHLLSNRPCIVGDSAYPTKPWLLKKFCVHHVDGVHHVDNDDLKREFDADHCKARVKIENTFSHLKGKWKICKKMTVDLMDVPMVSTACAVLHNFVKMDGVALRDVDRVPLGTPARRVTSFNSRARCHRIRDAFFRHWLANRVHESPSPSLSDL